MTDADIDRLTERIIGCGIEVHRTLGPGLLESVYKECLPIELSKVGLKVVSEQSIRLDYKGAPLQSRLRVDLLVEDTVIIELKAVETIHPVCVSQVITYLRITDLPVGLIMNFNVSSLRKGIRRVVHPSRYRRTRS